MNHLVKLIENVDGEIDESEQHWCASANFDTARTLCGETLDEASHYVAVYKSVKRGGITCKLCRNVIIEIKEYKL